MLIRYKMIKNSDWSGNGSLVCDMCWWWSGGRVLWNDKEVWFFYGWCVVYVCFVF